MCGIIGIASKHSINERKWLSTGLETIKHRGPDDGGEWWSDDGRVGLGHRRLAIIDLSEGGHQPMLDSTGELCLVFNGEIYNYMDLKNVLIAKGYIFRTQSDTEVILASYREWGSDCLTRLNGMFSFALYDQKKNNLVIARDRAGEKPLFYYLTNNSIRFASELKGILVDKKLSLHIDPEAIDCYLAFGYIPGDLCIIKGVKKLPPANVLTFNLNDGKVEISRYWNVPEPVQEQSLNQNEDSLINELESLLSDSVCKQMVADVPVGVLLSGGVDSSVITALASRATKNIKTFTVRFPQYEKYDESEHARMISKYFGTEHIELIADKISVEIVNQLAIQFDEPVNDSSIIPMSLICKMVKGYCTVAIGGDGGDELFGGYNHYYRLLKMSTISNKIPRFLRHFIGKMAGHFLPVGFKGRNWLQAFECDFHRNVPLIASYFDIHTRRKLLHKIKPWPIIAECIRNNRMPNTGNLLDRATRLDFENYLAEDILVKVDRSSMLNSLEVRAPFLDYRIIEFAYGKVPSCLKVNNNKSKIILKKLAARLLPLQFDFQRKQGFTIPLQIWLQSGPWLEYFKQVLLDDNDSIFNKKIISMLFDGQKKGYANNERLFSLVLFELWRKEYGLSI